MATQAYVRHHVDVDVIGLLWIAEDRDGRLYFPVRASCDALGIDYQNAVENIKGDSRLAPGLTLIRLPSGKDGRAGEQEQQCLRSSEYSWWLAMLDPKRMRSLSGERRAAFVERQKALMHLAEEIMLRRQELRQLPTARRSSSPQTAASISGQVSGDASCPHCGGPLHMTLDGNGWRVHPGIEVK